MGWIGYRQLGNGNHGPPCLDDSDFRGAELDHFKQNDTAGLFPKCLRIWWGPANKFFKYDTRFVPFQR